MSGLRNRSVPQVTRKAALWLPFFVCLMLVAAPAGQAEERVVPRSTQEVKLSYAPAVKRARPAVVNIYARKIVRSQGVSPLFDDPVFGRFFGQFFSGRPRERVENSLGSGVIVRPGGVIVTNSHVIRDAREIVVVLGDGREFEATLVVDDPQSDLAVLRIEAEEDLPYVEMADSDAAEVGDIVLAIGNPFGVGQTVTSGIVSATARTRVDISDYQFFIQTDAAINPGNSGGALIDLSGRLLGINSAIYSRSGGSQGIGFAIPSNLVESVVASAVSEGRVVRPWVGVTVQDVTAELAESLGLERPRGVMVTSVHPDSSFRAAGLRAGDLILSVNGFAVDNRGALLFRVATRQVGETAEIAVLRNGREEMLDVTLIAAPEDPPRNVTRLEGTHPLSGATVGNLSPAYAEELGADSALTGIIVSQIDGRSYAARLGLQPGDIILSVNGEDVRRVADLEAVLDQPERRWSLRIRRDGRVRSVTVQL